MNTTSLVALKAKLASERAMLSLYDYVKYLDSIPEGAKSMPKKWGIGLQRHEALVDLDLNALLTSAHQLFSYCKKMKQCAKIIPKDMAEIVAIFRHNYEHWDENNVYFQENNTKKPKRSARVFIDKYRTKSKESPKGYFSFDWKDVGGRQVLMIAVGGVLKLNDLNKTISEIESQLNSVI